MTPKSFQILTFGCQMNVRDSKWLERALLARGFASAPLEEADIVLLNTCSVREKPRQKIETALRRVAGMEKRDRVVGVIGCVAQQLGRELFASHPEVRLVAGGASVDLVPDALGRILAGAEERLALLEFADEYRERDYDPGFGASRSVIITQGCDNFCAYCIVPYTRGRQKSRRLDAVLAECQNRLAEGATEITLLGQNVNAWGKDLDGEWNFARLLDRVASLDSLRRLRFVSPHPADMDGASARLFGEWEKICPRLHLPLQSGSDRVLKRMRRRYTSADFLRLVETLKKARPDIVFSTDLIVGFPGESEEDFQATTRLVREVGFVASYSFRYSDRPGVASSLMPDKVEDAVMAERLIRLQETQEEIGQAWLAGRVGETTELLIEGPSPRQDGSGTSWQGRDPYGAAVHVRSRDPNPVGEYVRVGIVAAKKHSLIGEEIKPDGA